MTIIRRIGRLRKAVFVHPVQRMIAAVAVLGSTASAQSTQASAVTLLGEALCGVCAVRLTSAGKFGLADDDGALRGFVRLVSRSKDGRVLIANENGGAPQVYDSTGRFFKMLGRSGSGPGEFRHTSAMVPLNDGRWVIFDDGLRRINVFSAELRYLTSFSSPVRTYDAAQWRNDSIVVAANVATQAAFGMPLHTMRLGSDSLRSFAFDAVKPFGVKRIDRTHLAVVGIFLCAVRERRLAVTCSDGGNAPPTELSMRVPWFTTDEPLRVSDSTPPVPILKTLTSLGPGQLALAVLVPGSDWKRGVVSQNGPDGRTTEIVNYDVYYDTVILVIDIARKALISSTKVPQALTLAAGDGLFASMQTLNDVPYIALWRVQDSSPQPKRSKQ